MLLALVIVLEGGTELGVRAEEETADDVPIDDVGDSVLDEATATELELRVGTDKGPVDDDVSTDVVENQALEAAAVTELEGCVGSIKGELYSVDDVGSRVTAALEVGLLGLICVGSCASEADDDESVILPVDTVDVAEPEVVESYNSEDEDIDVFIVDGVTVASVPLRGLGLSSVLDDIAGVDESGVSIDEDEVSGVVEVVVGDEGLLEDVFGCLTSSEDCIVGDRRRLVDTVDIVSDTCMEAPDCIKVGLEVEAVGINVPIV
ncbi:uncharacterized protein PG986_001923 [Apiospora aurea]|uniref:Uncharacterized protein n=1 Tax=Apiospora aurea TaxID=335848 RepID=A0ABR1QY82_9PEZI